MTKLKMGSGFPEYKLLTFTRFSAFVFEFRKSSEIVHVLQSSEPIQAVSVSSYPCQSCYAVIASHRSMWRVLLSQNTQDNDGKTSQPAKKKKKGDEVNQDDDIFADLLGEKGSQVSLATDSHHTQTSKDTSLPQTEGKGQQFTVCVQLKEEHRLCTHDLKIIDIVAHESTLVLLADDEGIAHIKIYQIKNITPPKATLCTQSFSTGIETNLLYQDYESNWRKTLYLVLQEEDVQNPSRDVAATRTSSQVVTLPQDLFVLLFGKEAGCLRSPVLLLCDTKGCVYFCYLKSSMSGASKIRLLCETGSNVVTIAKIELNGQQVDGKTDSREIISQLESALDGETNQFKKEQSSSVCLVAINTAGDCYLFRVSDGSSDAMLMFSLPQPVYSCLVNENRIYYLTDESIELCTVSAKFSKYDNLPSVTVSQSLSLFKGKARSLVTLTCNQSSNGNVLVAMSDDIELIYLPTSRESKSDSSTEVENKQVSMETILNRTACHSEDIKSVHGHISHVDMCLLQLNLFASIFRNRTLSSQDSVLKPEEAVVMCNCGVSIIPSTYSHETVLLVKLDNKTSSPFSDDWKLDVHISRVSKKETNFHFPGDDKHFIISLSQGLAPNSSISVPIPLDSPCITDFSPYLVVVSLILSLDQGYNFMTKSSTQLFKKSMSVLIHRHTIDALDFMHIIKDTDPRLGSATLRGMHSSFSNDCMAFQNLELDTQMAPHLSTIARRLHRGVRDKNKKHPFRDNQTFTVTLGVSEKLCKKHNVEIPSDVLRLLLTRGQVNMTGLQSSPHVQLRAPAGNAVLSIAVAAELGQHDKTEDISYVVTLRSSDVALLMVARESVKARFEAFNNQAGACKRDSCRSKVRQDLLQYERLAEDLQSLGKKFKSMNDDESCPPEDTMFLCSLFDKCDMIK